MCILCVRVKNAMGKEEVELAKGIREATGRVKCWFLKYGAQVNDVVKMWSMNRDFKGVRVTSVDIWE